MNLIQQIAEKRQMLLDGIDANDGDINLQIFEDFYPDEAHFIFELLQNAEDAGGSEACFELNAHGCSFEHNGTRHFNEEDIRGITGIFNSSKKKNPDKIGKFGVGFKSVFVYTATPIIYSKHYSFRIFNLVVPHEVPTKPGLGDRTRFEFPFNEPKKNVKEAFTEIKSALEQLSANTLLFLRNLKCIKWKIGDRTGYLKREEHSEVHVEVLKHLNGNDALSSHWLRYSAPVEGIERQQVSIAFELSSTGDKKTFDTRKAIKEQMKISPAVRGKVSVFFPADKETSGLRFHLHGPFVPELSRASIKNSPINLPLFEQIAKLTAKSLHSIKSIGLLNGEFLAVLPNNEDHLPERYRAIRTAVLDEMRSTALTPTYQGGHAPAAKLVQARASLKALLTPEDLASVTDRQDHPEWVIGATQKNSNQDRLLVSLGIPTWDTGDLIDFLEARLRISTNYLDSCELNQEVLRWIASKPFEWLQALYALLFKFCEENECYYSLNSVYFIPLASGKWGIGKATKFQTDPLNDSDLNHRVDERIFKESTKKSQPQDARKFLEKIGVREPNELDELEQLLNNRYKKKDAQPTDAEYLKDLQWFISIIQKNEESKRFFSGAKVFKITSLESVWESAEKVFLDEPFRRTELNFLYELIIDHEIKRWPLDSWYLECGIPVKDIVNFAEALGCQKEFDRLSIGANCGQNSNWGPILSKASGERQGNVINRDFALAPEAEVLLNSQSLPAIQLVWKALCRSDSVRPNVLEAVFQWTDKGGPRKAPSQLVCALRELAWVPQTDGSFVQPRFAVAEKLPKGLTIDADYKWLDAVEFGAEEKKQSAASAERTEHLKALGLDSEEELSRFHEFKKLPEEEQKRILAEAKHRREPVELPFRTASNPELRNQRVGADARSTPNKSAAIRARSVQLGVSEAKAEAKVYLQGQYTNSQGQMICQVCKDELPFKLPSGSYYFEAVEMLAESSKRYRATYLALCPNHAAAYQYANGQRNSMQDVIANAASLEVEVDLGGEETTIYFTQMHLADAKASLAVESEETSSK